MSRRILLAVSATCAFAASPALMPLPVAIGPASGSLAIDGTFAAATASCPDPRMRGALDRLVARVSRQTGILMGVSKPADPARPALRVECGAAGPQYPALGENESYTLDITPGGAVLQSATGTGALRGLETFAQLIGPGPAGFQVPALHIEDRPRFAWRGLMIDVSRHWIPRAIIERNLDAMASVKLNVFHWHLSDDQGFRVESKRYPRLQELGSDGRFYTQDEIREVVAYARDRGIRVIPEFDVPGHTGSWLPGYPELAAAPGPFTPARTWGVFDPVMDPAREQVYQFLDGFIGEMAPLFPDPFFHIGGDEVNGREWRQSEALQKFAREHNLEGPHGLQVYFNQRLLGILAKYGKTMVGWDEILHPDLPAASVIQSWRGAKSLADAAAQGHRAILSSGYYLDHMETAATHYAVDPLGGAASQLTPEQAALILGGEACMWAEYVNAETVDSRIWPRAAAIAERFWSPAAVTDAASMYDRMESISRSLEWTGVHHRAAYGPMLDRIAGGRPAGPLRLLASVSEATGLRVRARAAKYTSLTPLNRFVDAIPAESEAVRSLELAAARVTANYAGAVTDVARLREEFARWASNDAPFQSLAQNNGLAAELKPLSANLSALGGAGLRILDYLAAAGPAPAAWIASETEELTRVTQPNAEVVLAAVRPVRILFDALSARK